MECNSEFEMDTKYLSIIRKFEGIDRISWVCNDYIYNIFLSSTNYYKMDWQYYR